MGLPFSQQSADCSMLFFASDYSPSGDQFSYDPPVHVREKKVPAGVAVGQLLVIEAKEPENGGLKIVNVELFFSGLEAEFVGRSVGLAPLDAATSQPHRESIMVMIATIDFARVGAGRGQ